MPNTQQFRTAFRGFHRQDVVQYIEFMTNKHKTQLEQVNTQLQSAKEELAQAKAVPANEALQQQLDAALARCAELEAKLAETSTAAAVPVPAEQELEAYRRAERAERLAQERAAQVYAQANAVLADVTLKVRNAAEGVKAVAAQASAQLQSAELQLQDAVDTMSAIRPQCE